MTRIPNILRIASFATLFYLGACVASDEPLVDPDPAGLNGSAVRVKFNGVPAFYFGTRNYTSHNSCP